MVETRDALRQIDPTIAPGERLIVALDYSSTQDAVNLIERLGEKVSFYKVGWTLFVNAGKDFIASLIQTHRKKVFLDLKMNDIGATMEDAVKSISEMGVEFLTLHGNGQTAEAARKGRGEKTKPKFLSVTYLSSLDQTDLKDIFYDDHVTLPDYIRKSAELSLDAGCDGLIASGESVGDLRSFFQAKTRYPLIVVPGIRPTDTSKDDHKRTLTPIQAIKAGADYLVVGRPIREASDPVGVTQSIISEIEAGLSEK